VQLAQLLSSNHRVVLPWCIQALGFIELPVDSVNNQGFNDSLAVRHFFSRQKHVVACGKNAAAAENGHIFQLLRAVTHISELHTIKAKVCCVQECTSSILACIVLAVESICKI
jgi:hypothetical protein